MAIANVTLSDTFFQWMTKTNQINFQSEEAISIATISYGGSNSAAVVAGNAFGKANLAYAQANTGWAQANTARDQANVSFLQANVAWLQANTARDHANVAYNQANTTVSAYGQANTARSHANAAFTQANSAFSSSGPSFDQANTARNHANTGYGQANTARDHANTAYAQANGAYNQATLARGHANTAHEQANTARTQANVAFITANTVYLHANAAYFQANTARDQANVAFLAANNAGLGMQSIYVPASTMIARSTSGAAAGTIEMPTYKIMQKTLNFDPATIEYAQFSIQMPKSWNESTLRSQFVWTHPTGTGAVVWSLEAVAFADTDAIDAAFGTAVTIADTGGTANAVYITANTAPMTVAGTPGAGELVVFQVSRVASDGGDTLGVDARLLGVTILYTVNAQSDD
jgi:hypothetical protein